MENFFDTDELRVRAFRRIVYVLKDFWEEQKHENKDKADIHSRLFDTLIHRPLIEIGNSTEETGHWEHVVPCKFIRDKAYAMFRHDKYTDDDVVKMVSRLLCVAHITKDEAHRLDHVEKLKTTMPPDWDFETGSILARLDVAGITLDLNEFGRQSVC